MKTLEQHEQMRQLADSLKVTDQATPASVPRPHGKGRQIKATICFDIN